MSNEASEWTGVVESKRDLTAGPLGRAVLAELVGASWLIKIQLGQRVDHDDAERAKLVVSRLGQRPDGITTAVGRALADYAYGGPSEWRRHDQSLSALMPLLDEVSELVVASESIAWWWDDVALTSQRWVQAPSAITLPNPTPAHVAAAVAEFACHENAYGYEEGELNVREFHPVAGAKVHEIRNAANWATFFDRFPKQATFRKALIWNDMFSTSGHWIEPDWQAGSEEFDGVSISVAGYLAAAYNPMRDGDYRTVLSGRNPDQTIWLGGGFTFGRSIASVHFHDASRESG